ncbi:1-acyl-sn-glycerol-3-phosphate acyltransferase [bacterium]|nr:1-acyl-sn-glycerol-3-phosphate acyltransferase [bacterium]
MGIIRLFFRAILILGWTLFAHIFIVRTVQIFFKKKRVLSAISIWGKGLAWIMGIRIHQLNERSGPMGDLVVANHMGFLDIPVMSTFFPAVYIIKEEASKPFYFGSALVKQGHVFVNRNDKKSGTRSLINLMKILKEGDRIIVFPEGRAWPKKERLPFKPAAFAAAKKYDKLVEGVVIDYLPDRKELEWDVTQSTVKQLAKLFGKRRIDISVEFFPSEKVESTPDEYAQMWHDRVEQRFASYDAEKQEKSV